MAIIYVLTIVLMITLHMLLYKKQEYENILKWLSISIVIFLCYNIFICVIMTFIKIPSTLNTLSIFNILVSGLFAIKIYKDKKIQKYSLSKMDIFAVLIILIIVISISIKQYGIEFNIKNKITDAAIHYFTANEFYHTSYVLINQKTDVLGVLDFKFHMPGAYINTGILFKIFSGIIEEIYFYKLYFIFDISIWILSGILMYVLLSQGKERKQKIIPLIFSLIYMLGYPLESLLSGFSYLSLGLNIIITTLILMKEEINNYYKYILLFFVNFGIFFSYYLFVPIVYFSVFLQIIINIKRNKEKLFSIKNILNFVYTLIIPGILGILYFFVFQILKYGITPNYGVAINIKGSIYSNLITNIFIFLLLSIYYLIDSIKNKKIYFENIMFLLTLGFVIILFIGMKLNKVSEYYYYKTYYLTWIIVIYNGYKGIEQIIQKNKKAEIISYAGIGIYLIGVICTIIIQQKLFIFDIFSANSNEVQTNNSVAITSKEVEVLKYYNENINTNSRDNQTYMCFLEDSHGIALWVYGLTRNPYTYVNISYGEPSFDISQYVDSDKKYAVILKRHYYGNYDEIEKGIDENNLHILFKNEDGIVLEKN